VKEYRNLFHALIFIAIVSSLSFVCDAEAQSPRDIAKKAFPSVVILVMDDSHGQPISLGSGFFVKKDVVATNLHVIEGAVSGYAKIVGKKPKYDIAGFVAADPNSDLVLLKVKDVNSSVLSLGDSNEVAVGDEVYAIGNPQGLEGTFSKGIISGIRRLEQDSLLQITAPISPGSSGGPVLDIKGKVIGVSVATFEGGQNLNFAIPISYLRSLLSDLKPVKSLTDNKQLEKGKSLLHSSGVKSIESVIGTHFLWESSVDFSFSLRNKLRRPVTNVVCLVVFYDIKTREPVDTKVVKYGGIILPGLAKRLENIFVPSSVRRFCNEESPEIRILDFRIAEAKELF